MAAEVSIEVSSADTFPVDADAAILAFSRALLNFLV
jgi:hypothetical protein